MAKVEKQRINILFPASLLAELKEVVPPRERNRFIVQATEKELRRVRLARVIEELREKPAWRDEDHPDLGSIEDVARWLYRVRGTACRGDRGRSLSDTERTEEGHG